MSSSGTNSRDAATGNKIAKKQHSEAQANITSSGTTVIMDSSISTPTTRFSVDTVNSTTTTHSLNPIMTPNTISSSRSDQDPLIDRRLERRNMSPRRNCSAAAATTKALRDLFETIEITQSRIDSCSTTATHSLNQKTIPTTVPATGTIYQRCAQVLPESIKQVPLREDVQQSPNIKHIQYTVRFMVVGKKGVADVFSTDGVDIDVRWCKIDIGNDKWTIETVLLKEFITQLSVGEGIRYANVQQRSKTANICFVRITILGIISVGKIWKLLTKGSDDASSTDGVDIRWLDTSIKEEIGECTIEQVMYFQNIYEESEHLSMYLNANEKSLPSVKLMQKSSRRGNEVKKIICGVLGTSRDAIVGSGAEGLTTTGSDVDVIKIGHTFEVFDCIREPFNMVVGHCQSIRQPEKRHPGYSKLSVISLDFRYFEDDVSKYTFTEKKDGKVYLKNNVKEIINSPDSTKHYSIHGPAFSHVIYPQKPNSHQDDFDIFQTNESMSADVVFCIGSNQWPDEAYEWRTRIRASDWPTRKLVDHIIKTGYLLAGVGSKESHESELQWRISFNEAEQLMIESLNETQIHCIFLLKLMKNISLSNIAGKNITSYSMKTVMFWCLEEKQDTFWQYSNLVVCFCFCVTKLKSFVERGFLPNYFIRKRNQFVAKEFTSDIQTRTLKYLEGFLKDPKAGLRLILPLYRKSEVCQIPIMHYSSQLNFILIWLKLMITVEYIPPFELLLELYDGCNIHYISKRCNKSLDKLMNVGYTQPLIKRLQNYLGVLQYILIKEEKQKGKDSADSNARKTYSEYMKLSASGDLTHNTLRIATCYLDDGVKEKCLNMIRTVTDLGEDFFVRTSADRLKESIQRSYEELNNHKTVHDIEPVIDIINNIDSIYKDPYRTTEKFEELKANGQLLIGYDVLINAWKRCYFDVTFMLAELPVLPEPAAVELLIDKKQTAVTFHPFLYGLLLEYLWHKKYGPENKRKELVLERMENYVSIASNIPDKQKAIGFNFLAFCYSLQKENQAAKRCLFQSLKFNSLKTNAAYLYFYILFS